MAARSLQWIVVIMDYDMPQHGRFNEDSRREDQVRRMRHTAPSQRRTFRLPRSISHIFHSMPRHRMEWK
jgi:hypothetical protein